MSARLLPLAAVAVFYAIFVGTLSAQPRTTNRPPRPRLAASADTNDAAAYYSHGNARLSQNPREAANAFYWAARLDPSHARALYARRVAMLLERNFLEGYIDGNRSVIRSAHVMTADSLYLRAVQLAPFLFRDLDRTMLDAYVAMWAESVSGGDAITSEAVRFYLENFLREAGPEFRGWLAYTGRKFPDAVRWYEQALRRTRDKAGIRTQLATIHFLANDYASAEREMVAALAELQTMDAKDIVYIYYSTVSNEYALGYIREVTGRPDAALEAYSRALLADPSFYPAHGRVARIALARYDTAAALNALALAADIESVDAGTRLHYAEVLVARGGADRAVPQLQAIIGSEPWFAAPWALLGQIQEQLGRSAEALESYAGFLARARRADPMRRTVVDRVAALTK